MTSVNFPTRIATGIVAALGVAHGIAALALDKPWAKEITKRIAAGKALQLDHYVIIGWWYAAVTGALLCLIAGIGLWLSARMEAGEEQPSTQPWTRGLLWGMAVVFCVALATRLPRLSQSLWNDELKAMEMFVVGETLQKDARHDFSDSWKRAIYANPEANNHVLCTIETRLAHKLWRVMHGDRNVPFSEAWLRFPAFLWGMLGIGLAGYLGALLGGTRMGLATAAVLAIHPWAVRFSTETRGYSAALACLLLVMLCLHQLIVQRKNDWRWWATLALALCLGMLAYLTSAVVVAGLEIVAVVVLLRRRDWRRLAWLMAANVLAATVFLDLYSPSIFQVSAFLKEKASGHLAPISLAWWQDVASAFTCGEDWHRGYLGMESMPWWQRGGLFVGCYGLTMVGLWQMWRRGGTAVRVCALAWLLAVAMMLLQNVLAKQAMLTWYLCPLLPGMALSMGFGLSGEGRKSRALTAALSLIWLASLAPFLGQLVSSPRQPVRDAAQMIKTRWPTAVVAYFGLTDQHVDAYLPTVRVQDRRESDEIDWIKNLQVEANTTHQPMVVWYGGNQEARSPQTMHYLHGQGFQEVARLHGVDEMYDMFVLFQSVATGGIPLSGASDDRH